MSAMETWRGIRHHDSLVIMEIGAARGAMVNVCVHYEKLKSNVEKISRRDWFQRWRFVMLLMPWHPPDLQPLHLWEDLLEDLSEDLLGKLHFWPQRPSPSLFSASGAS